MSVQKPAFLVSCSLVAASGWLGVRLDRKIDWGTLASLLEEGYRSVAPKRAIKQLDEA